MIIEVVDSEANEYTKEQVTAKVADLNQQLKEGKITNWRIYADHDYDGTVVVFEIAREETQAEKEKREKIAKRNRAACNEQMAQALRAEGFKVEEPDD